MTEMIEGATYRTRDGNAVSSPLEKTATHGTIGADYWWKAIVEGATRTFTNDGLYYVGKTSPNDLVETVARPYSVPKHHDQMTLEDWRTNIGKMWGVYGAGL